MICICLSIEYTHISHLRHINCFGLLDIAFIALFHHPYKFFCAGSTDYFFLLMLPCQFTFGVVLQLFFKCCDQIYIFLLFADSCLIFLKSSVASLHACIASEHKPPYNYIGNLDVTFYIAILGDMLIYFLFPYLYI